MKTSLYLDRKNIFFQILKNISWTVVVSLLILFFVGCIVLYSASGGSFEPLVNKHILKFLISISVFFLICFLNYNLIRDHSYSLYFLSLFGLIYLLFFGIESAGSKRWISIGALTVQPSEFAKIFLILALSRYYNDLEHIKNSSILKLIIPIIFIIFPFFFITSQPDLGTSLLLFANGICLIFLSGISLWIIFLGFIAFLFSIPIVWNFLHNYQKQRILTFLNPEGDPLGSGYHIAQSKIAIGSGGFTGKGYMEGSQSQLEFIPEIHTDFVFSIFSEEFGFLGSVIIIFLYLYLIIYGILSSYKTKNIFDKLLVFGLTVNFFFYFIVNVSMVIGLIPVVGVPLPIISYGGSSMLAVMISFGIIEKVNLNRKLS